MNTLHAVSFQNALDIIEPFPEYQQQDLIEIIQRRLIEKRHDSIAENTKETRAEYTV